MPSFWLGILTLCNAAPSSVWLFGRGVDFEWIEAACLIFLETASNQGFRKSAVHNFITCRKLMPLSRQAFQSITMHDYPDGIPKDSITCDYKMLH